LILIACDGPLPKEFLPGLLLISGWYLDGNGGYHLNGHNKKIPGQITDIIDHLLLEEQWPLQGS